MCTGNIGKGYRDVKTEGEPRGRWKKGKMDWCCRWWVECESERIFRICLEYCRGQNQGESDGSLLGRHTSRARRHTRALYSAPVHSSFPYALDLALSARSKACSSLACVPITLLIIDHSTITCIDMSMKPTSKYSAGTVRRP